jgi:hypothetical protein
VFKQNRLGGLVKMFGIQIRVSTLKKWETNNHVPEGPTKAYLMVIEQNWRAVKKLCSGKCRRRLRSNDGRLRLWFSSLPTAENNRVVLRTCPLTSMSKA